MDNGTFNLSENIAVRKSIFLMQRSFQNCLVVLCVCLDCCRYQIGLSKSRPNRRRCCDPKSVRETKNHCCAECRSSCACLARLDHLERTAAASISASDAVTFSTQLSDLSLRREMKWIPIAFPSSFHFLCEKRREEGSCGRGREGDSQS